MSQLDEEVRNARCDATHTSGDGALLEDHGVLGEGPGFVTEDVLDLSKAEKMKEGQNRST